jgi:hypothetical protein|tara:strand:+ start:124 stop:333 length:210 start_codon:yes stop_codon:yes gene_type:complete
MIKDEINLLDAVDNLILGLQQFQTQIYESNRKKEIVEGILQKSPDWKKLRIQSALMTDIRRIEGGSING